MKKAILLLLSITLILIPLCSCTKTYPGEEATNNNLPLLPEGTPDLSDSFADVSEMDFAFSNRDLETSYDPTATISLSDGGSSFTGTGVSVNGDLITLSQKGTYLISGSLSNGSVKVAVDTEEKIQLVLSNASITCADGPALYIESADKVFVTLADGTENLLADGSSYAVTESADSDSSAPDAALFSREDMTINGGGSLTVNGNYKHAVVSKDDLIVTGGKLTVNAKNVGLSGKDCVKICGADISITAGSDGIRSDNAEDENRGYIYIRDGSLDINAENDAIQAETVLKIEGGSFHLKTNGGSANASTDAGGNFRPGWGSTSASSSTESCKGLKAGSDILISGGTFTIDSSDDAIHSNGSISISDGDFTMASGDDGIHADTALGIYGGKLSISKSYEGIEGSEIVIAGGNISLVASDDGLNAAGGNDGSSMGGRPGQGGFSSSTGKITISGGYTLINASGDGIDSNGTVTVTGGVTLVSGPTNNGNGAFDYDGSATVSGGILIALGSSGMAQSFTSAQNQGAIFKTFAAQSANTPLTLCDQDGRVIVSFAPAKAYQSAVITAPDIQSGNTYTLVAGGTVASTDVNGYAENTTLTGGTTLASISMTSNLYGSSGGMGGMQPPGGGGGKPPRP